MWPLGSKKEITQDILALPELWFQVQVGADPALPPQQLRATPYALRAAVADAVACSGCIGAEQLDAKALEPYAKSASLATIASSGSYADLNGKPDLTLFVKAADLAGYAKVASLADVAMSGNYNDLINKPALPKLGAQCGPGLVLRGFAADGSYDCVAAMDAAALPADGLAKVSNGLLTNQFSDVIASTTTPVDIPDQNPLGAIDSIVVPDLGITQKLSISIDIANSDLATVQVLLTDPADNKYILYDKGAPGKALKATYPAPDKTVAGDLTKWVGKNPQGKWTLVVVDSGFLNNKLDGKINSWNVTVQTLSAKKVASTGAFLAQGGLQLPVADKAQFPCDAAHFGYMYASQPDKAIYICNGSVYCPITLSPYGTKENPATNCKDLLTKVPLSKTGVYYVDPDGAAGDAAYQVFCDMTTDGGGWTLVWNNLRGGAGKPMTNLGWVAATTTLPMVKGVLSENPETFVVFTGLGRWMQLGATQLRYSWANDYGSPIDQSMRCTYNLDANANYTINMSNCVELVGSVVPGLFTSHNGKPFTTIDADHDSYGTNCAALYTNSPWWYTSCWDGNINGGGENIASGYKNAAYWTGSANVDGTDAGIGGGNGWIFVR